MASHPKAKFWSDKNIKKPLFVCKGTNKKYIFDCNCGHEFEAILDNITRNNAWCPYCMYRTRTLCDKDDCVTCFNNSFASHHKSKYWSKRNKDFPRKLMNSSDIKKYWFDCITCGNDFKTTLHSITSCNTWCPHCINKTEKVVYEFLNQYYDVQTQKTFEWCRNEKTGKLFRFDYYIQSALLIIELDGRQHFVQVRNWNSPEKTRKHDVIKMKCVIERGKKVIRLLQNDVIKNDKWKNLLIDSIESEETKNVTYLTESNIYNNHIDDMKPAIIPSPDYSNMIDDLSIIYDQKSE